MRIGMILHMFLKVVNIKFHEASVKGSWCTAKKLFGFSNFKLHQILLERSSQ